MRIADVFFGALLDDAGLQVQAVKAGDKAGQTMGGRMSKTLSTALGTGLKAGLAVVAGGAAIALKGLAALDEVTAKFARDTGATRQEAEAAGKAINEIAGHNLQPLAEVGDVMAQVKVQMGLTGDELNRVTDLTLKYATATGQDAVGAVKAFDDIQDAWNLTSADTQSIMDDLIASHQKYGGELTDNQAALAKMAPQLQALNADWRDGIGLLNLFAASGLDSSKALTALNTAVKKLKPGQNLDDLVREVSSIEDPTKRAQKAIEIFGAKGGVALANALRPGIHSLKDFEVSAKDAGGATDRAFTNGLTILDKVKLAVKGVGSQLIGLGQDFGPLLTGLAGGASLLGSLGLGDKLVRAFKAAGSSPAVLAAAEGTGRLVGGALAGAFGIAEKVVEAATEGLSNLAERAGIKLFAAKAGATIGSVFAGAMALAEKLGEAAVDAFLKLPGIPKLRNAILASAAEIGTLQGTAIGEAAGLAMVGAFVLALPLLGKAAYDWLKEHGIDLAPKVKIGAFDVSGDDKPILDLGKVLGGKAADSFGEAFKGGILDGSSDRALFATAGEKYGDQMVAAWKAQAPAIAKAVSQVVSSSIANPHYGEIAREQGYRQAGALADGIQSAIDLVDKAWQDLVDAIKNTETPSKRAARLLGRLASKELAGGLNDGRPEVRLRAEEVFQTTLDELKQIVTSGGQIGKVGMEALRRGMHSKNYEIRKASYEIYRSAINSPQHLPEKGAAYGLKFATGLAHGMTTPAAQSAIEDAGATVTRWVNRWTKISSPAEIGPWHDHPPAVQGQRFTESLAKGMVAGVPSIAAAGKAIASAVRPIGLGSALALPGGGTMAVSGAGAVSGSVAGSSVSFGDIHLHGIGSDVSPAAAKRFSRDFMLQVAAGFRQEGAQNGLHPRKP